MRVPKLEWTTEGLEYGIIDFLGARHRIAAIFSVATAIVNVFQNNGISVGRNLAKILKIFEKIDEVKGRGVI
jgi:hypothetical protein